MNEGDKKSCEYHHGIDPNRKASPKQLMDETKRKSEEGITKKDKVY